MDRGRGGGGRGGSLISFLCKEGIDLVYRFPATRYLGALMDKRPLFRECFISRVLNLYSNPGCA